MTITEVKTSESRLDRLRIRIGKAANWLLEVRRVGAILAFLSLATGIYGFSVENRNPDGTVAWNWEKFVIDYYTNISTELGSVAVAVLIIDSLNQRRAREDDKARLIRQMRSTERGLALNAVEELKAMGAVKDGSLQKAYLEEARLHGVRMGRADLRGARMDFADLSGAQLFFANLEGADMSGSDFREAMLTGANLRGVDFVAAKLQGALLSEADLTGANLDKAIFDESTQLPDQSTWHPKVDLRRFTDPTHTNYWRSQMPESPAFTRRRN